MKLLLTCHHLPEALRHFHSFPLYNLSLSHIINIIIIINNNNNNNKSLCFSKFLSLTMAMAMARLASRKLHQRLLPSSSSSSSSSSLLLCREEKSAFEKRFCTEGGGEKSSKQGREVAVTEGGIKSKLFPKRRRKRNLWRGNSIDRDFVVPALYEFFPSGLGNALMQATKNINKLLSNLPPVSLIGTVKEQDDCYKLRYEMPGLAKEDLKITIEDGYLTIKGEHKEEKEDEESDDEHWSVQKYGYYDTRVMLPEDAKADEIKAELKDGVLSIVIPRSEKQKKDVKEIQVD